MSSRRNHAKRSRKTYKLQMQRMRHALTGNHAKARMNGGNMNPQ